MMSLISIFQTAKNLTDIEMVAKILFCGIVMSACIILNGGEVGGFNGFFSFLAACFLFFLPKRSIWNNDNAQLLQPESQVVKPKKENKKKEEPAPVLDEKKKKGSKKNKKTKKVVAKENRDPMSTKEKTKMYEGINACQMLNMTEKDIYNQLYKLILTERELLFNNYPAENYLPRNLVSADCDFRLCVRCGMDFEVFNGMYLSSTGCRYHPKKATYDPATTLKVYPCCNEIVGAKGCTDFNYHVTVQHGPRQLTKTASRRHVRRDLQHRVFSLDCEMSYTTAGLEVTRIGLVDLDGMTVYDSYVKPKNHILDYNTQYSGVEKRHLEHITITLDDVKKILGNIIHEDTILVGHALNNDLAALGLIHKTVVDTSVLYKSEFSPYNKRSLKSLALEFLDISIQNDPSGHDCIDDARASLQLALLKIPPNPPSVPRPFESVENIVNEQSPVESKNSFNAQKQQQPVMDMQNFTYVPVSLPCPFTQHQDAIRKNCYYYNPAISYYAPYPALLKRCV